MAQQSALRVELVAPAAVRAGEPVPVTIRITNPTDKPVDAYFVGREVAFDIVVRKAAPPEDTTIVWRRLFGRAVQAVLQVRTLAPGEILLLRDTWQQLSDAGSRVPAGNYTVQGIVLGQDKEQLRTPALSLEIRL